MLLPWVSIVPTDAQFWLSNNKMVVSEWAKHFFFGSIVCKKKQLPTTGKVLRFTSSFKLQNMSYDT